MLMSVVGWVLFGLVAGAVARAIHPGFDPMGYVGTIPPSFPINAVYQWSRGPEEAILRVALRQVGMDDADLSAVERTRLLEVCRVAKEALGPSSRRTLIELSAVLPGVPDAALDLSEILAETEPLVEYSTEVNVHGSRPQTLTRQLRTGVYLLEIRERDIDRGGRQVSEGSGHVRHSII